MVSYRLDSIYAKGKGGQMKKYRVVEMEDGMFEIQEKLKAFGASWSAITRCFTEQEAIVKTKILKKKEEDDILSETIKRIVEVFDK